MSPKAHSIWTEEILRFMQFPPCTEVGLSFGIYLCSTILYHSRPGVLTLHMDNGEDVKAIMERRNS